MTPDRPGDIDALLDACRTVRRWGFTPVVTRRYQRLRAWLNATGGWPPEDWKRGDPVPAKVRQP